MPQNNIVVLRNDKPSVAVFRGADGQWSAVANSDTAAVVDAYNASKAEKKWLFVKPFPTKRKSDRTPISLIVEPPPPPAPEVPAAPEPAPEPVEPIEYKISNNRNRRTK